MGDVYRLTVAGGDVVASQLVLATGMVDEVPDVDGFLDHYGVDAFHCVYCDGYATLGRRVVVLGWHPHVGEVAIQLLEWASQVTVVTQGHTFEGAVASLRRRDIRIIEDRATSLLGPRGRLTGVRLSSGGTVECEFLFFYLARRPLSELARRLGCKLDGDGMVETDQHCHTSVRGIFAAGDVTPGMQFVQAAAAKGAAAGMACARLIRARRADPTRATFGS
jgi:thioredoxin reductase